MGSAMRRDAAPSTSPVASDGAGRQRTSASPADTTSGGSAASRRTARRVGTSARTIRTAAAMDWPASPSTRATASAKSTIRDLLLLPFLTHASPMTTKIVSLPPSPMSSRLVPRCCCQTGHETTAMRCGKNVLTAVIAAAMLCVLRVRIVPHVCHQAIQRRLLHRPMPRRLLHRALPPSLRLLLALLVMTERAVGWPETVLAVPLLRRKLRKTATRRPTGLTKGFVASAVTRQGMGTPAMYAVMRVTEESVCFRVISVCWLVMGKLQPFDRARC